MEFGSVIFLLCSALVGHSAGFTTTDYSCQNNCGYYIGSCSCSSSCLYYGNCCHDYHNYCVGTTTPPATAISTPPTPPTTPHADYITCRNRCGYDGGICSCTSSCRYGGHCCDDYDYYCSNATVAPTAVTADYSCLNNCGYNFGSCSCSSSCRYNGNCCHDYYDYCVGTTAPPATAYYSCRNNCGYNFGSCSCSSSCRSYGNCCHDYYDYCVGTTTPPATAYYSCRNNCGYNFGSCSCYSSCRYYGNCCHDYYDYCVGTTAPPATAIRTTPPPTRPPEPEPSTDYITCRNRCGYDGGICSCTSSCRYGGHCCDDYDYYCSNATISPTAGEFVCGENLVQSRGEFFSPLYPGNYPNNARCTWTLQAGELQMVLLNFTFVDLESCCDFIRVYDGPTAYHSLLGSITGNQIGFFNSSSRYMTVVFSTDGSVTRRGFRAEWSFKYIPMCKDRCGTSNSRCSCESSCERYGRCCHDYYDYCSYTTSPPVPACGGSHYGSGFISSPYYPGYYHDNAYCEWRLSAPAGQTIFLSFQDFDLERCCNCDYVNVYDGPSTASRLLGKLCHNSTNHLDFQSSSSYMTVLFRSDYSGVGRGFKAYFSSSLNQNTGRVDCSSDWMNIAIRKSYLDSLGFSWHDLYLDDHRCRPSTDYNYVTFNFPLNSCSTRRKTENGRIIYTNNVRAAQSTSGEITRRDTNFLMFVSCVMERDSSVGTLYEAKESANATISGTGHFNTTMAFFPSSSFSYPITESPYKVDLNQQLYVQVQLKRAEPSLHLFMDTCVASPNHDFTGRTYDLIRNGCSRESTVYIYRNGDRYFAQFSFRAFMFLRTHNQVFLRCDVIICADNDYNSRCRQGCRNRRKRSSSSDHHTEVITVGPITLKGPEEVAAKKEDVA
ncbi:CUB and zona pellucida-like domain-containing protein 1 isoform X4 [Tachysurus fulvidraco]|uniref:CUB and zona pellucida-like domain-containing protein 1 isoform X4 n=1 Tax=Tachysurus fulvidraco TaxID=1234273 RepID=UPI001FF03C67|nr:CUB and zona pellucida-like domain-containing protein 1 isoform X4 [Tachysurus fulvidraco]